MTIVELTHLYKDLHRHPELSFQEHRTARKVADWLTKLGYDVSSGVGGTGVVGRLGNGPGPTVLLRADMDALPVEEATGLPYASTATGIDADGATVPVMHACGHDMHMACLVGAADQLIRARADWAGTLLVVFQPGEEVGSGARRMVEDGLYRRFGRPDIVLGQHVMPLPAGTVGWRAGPTFAATDAFRVTLFGKGAHGSRPEVAVDPVVMAAAVVMRLQTVVSREIAAGDTAVVTVGSIRAGVKGNIIPDDAEIRVSIRTYTPGVRRSVLAAFERIVAAEAAASNAPRAPEIVRTSSFPVLENDARATARTVAALEAALGPERVVEIPAVTASEDVGELATAADAPLCFWTLGGTDPRVHRDARLNAEDVPSNHQATYAPVIEPTLSTGVRALAAAARTWLSDPIT